MYKTTLTIQGMACPRCEARVNDAVRKAFSVQEVSSSHKKGVTEVISEAAMDEAALKAAIEAGGFTVLDVKSKPHRKGFFGLFG